MINLSEAVAKIKKVGSTNARAVPMPGKTIQQDHQIEIKENNNWTPILTGITKKMAEDLISQATNKVILG